LFTGKGSGSLVGGYLMKAVGTRATFQIFSAVTLITGCIYYAFNHIYIVKRRHDQEKQPEHPFGGGFGNKLTPAAIDKQREAEETINSCDKIMKLRNHMIESTPLKTLKPTTKYTLNLKDMNSSNHSCRNSGKIIDSGGVNLGYIDDESKHHSQSHSTSSDSRNEDKR